MVPCWHALACWACWHCWHALAGSYEEVACKLFIQMCRQNIIHTKYIPGNSTTGCTLYPFLDLPNSAWIYYVCCAYAKLK